MRHYILTLEQKAAIRYIVCSWKLVDKRPSKQNSWYPCDVQMRSALKKLLKIITISASKLPKPIMEYVLSPITDYNMLEKHAFDFYGDFKVHPSEYLEAFIIDLERKNLSIKRKKKNPPNNLELDKRY